MSSQLLLAEPPLVVLPTLAVRLGVHEAILLQQIHFLLQNPKNGRLIDGERWIYRTVQEWLEALPFFSRRTLERVLSRLEKLGALRSIQPNKGKWDHTKHYRVAEDAAILADSPRQNGGIDTAILAVSKDTETTTETTNREKEESLVQDKPAPPPEETLFQTQEETPPPPSRGPADVIREHLFPYYLAEAGRGDYGLTPLRLKKGVERLRECLKRTGDPSKAVEMFEQAIDGLTGDPWNCGVNPQKKKYLDWIDHLCVSPEMFDKRLEAGVAA